MSGLFVHENLFGGQGEVRVEDLLGDAALGAFTAVLRCELAPGGNVGRHVQEHFPELVIGISGEGIARVDDAALPLVAGSVVQLPLGSTLAIDNHSDVEPLRYMIVKTQP